MVPAGFLVAGYLRTAGKALSIASPLLFLVAAAPLLLRSPGPRRYRFAAALFVVAHALTGLLRPALAASPGGTVLSGLPGSAELLALQKSGMDWRMDRLVAELGGCRGVIVDVRQPLMNEAVQLVATDIGLTWSSTFPVSKPDVTGMRVRAPYQPAHWDEADCIATDGRSDLHKGRRVLWLNADMATFEFLAREAGTLEIGVANHPGVSVSGAHLLEEVTGGPLRWTSARTIFRVPNSLERPATALLISCWPLEPPAGVSLRATINGRVAFDGPVPHDPIEIPIGGAAGDEWLEIEIRVTPVTHFESDPRDLGVALRQLTLRKGK